MNMGGRQAAQAFEYRASSQNHGPRALTGINVNRVGKAAAWLEVNWGWRTAVFILPRLAGRKLEDGGERT
jgi:hypothetical protein